jgi:transposase
MRAVKIDDAEEMLWVLQDEIRRSEEARYDHRLHGVLLVAQGMSAPQVAQLLGDGTRTVEYWVRRFNTDGLSGLVAPRCPRGSEE